jgi:DNA polymerase-3 subunit gamma/tau
MGFEMTLLRMLAFRPADEPDAPRNPATRGASAAARAQRSAPAGAASTGGLASASGAPSAATNGAASGSGGASSRGEASASGAVTAASRKSEPAPQDESSARVVTATVAGGGARTSNPARPIEAVRSSDIDWPGLLKTLDLRGPARQLADHCDLQASAGSTWQLVLSPDKQHLNTQQLRSRVEAALRDHFGRELKLAVVAGIPARATPADLRKANENERMREAREALENDPNVQALQAQLDATLEADSVRPTK